MRKKRRMMVMDIKKNSIFTVEELMILAENGQKDMIFGVGYYYEN